MLETSKDLLYVVISFSVLWLTIFLCWMLYYVIMLLKQAYDLVHNVRQKIEKIEKFFDFIRSKVEKSSSHLGLVSEGVEKLVKYLIEMKLDKDSEVKKNKKKK